MRRGHDVRDLSPGAPGIYPAEKHPKPDDCRTDAASGVCEYLPVPEKFTGLFLSRAFYPVLCLHRRSYRSDRQHLLPKESGERADGLKPNSRQRFMGVDCSCFSHFCILRTRGVLFWAVFEY